MKHFSVFLFLLFPLLTHAQLPGKTYVFKPVDGWRASVYFYNDSLFTLAVAEADSLVVETFLYEIDAEGTLHYCIPKQSLNPVIRTYRSEKPPVELRSGDRTRLFLINPLDPAYSISARWELYLDKQLITYGGEYDQLELQNMSLPGVGFSLSCFNRFYGENHLLTSADFSGKGDYFIIETMLPPLFFQVYTVVQPANLQHMVPLQFREGKLINPLTQQLWEEY